MSPIVLLFAAVGGLLFGSFLNVCIYRIPRDLSVVAPRSFCPECGRQLTWVENIPLLSFICLRGRCRTCKQPIGWRYPLVEAVCAVAFWAVVYRYGLSVETIKWILFEMILITLFCTDLEERLLPDELTLGGSFVALVAAFAVRVPGSLGEIAFSESRIYVASLLNAVLGALLLSLPIWAIAAVWGKVRRREALGLGDVKLLAMLGLFLGLERGYVVLLIASIAGAIFGAGIWIWKRKEIAAYEVPLGSFLCAAAALMPLFSTHKLILLAVP
jgi:leader peptidase (prepilin peptidase) / N-methyltransferase